jgi:hypothetical protein
VLPLRLLPFCLLALAGVGRAAPPDAGTWQKLADGMEYGAFTLDEHPRWSDGLLHVVRLDPDKVELKALLASENGNVNRTAGDWAAHGGVLATVNAGMYQPDQKTNVGYLRDGAHLNNPSWKESYKSMLVFGPQAPGHPPWTMVDVEADADRKAADDYRFAVQNLRLIRAESGRGHNVWSQNPRAWSEAAIAQDAHGRLLFLFSRSPLTMFDYNDRVLALPLGIVRAMHVEGGPEASLSIRAPGLKLDLCGSFETGFVGDDANAKQWAIPNVIGALPRSAKK